MAPVPMSDGSRERAAVLKVIHRYGAWTLLALVAGHAGAALRHHFIQRDGVLLRMIPRFRRTASISIARPDVAG
jgi:cytochrome b561